VCLRFANCTRTEILTIAEEVKSQTIERVLAKSDLEVGLEALLKKRAR